ncbi:hypothetical protein ACQ4PT_031877 [Festuca glaucescens]
MVSQLKYPLCVSATFLLLLLCMANAFVPEGKALLRWKSTLLNSASLSSWKHSNLTCSSWGGVTCDHAGHVTELYLGGYNLSGTLDALCSAAFPHLTLIYLYDNNLFGAIPTNISLLLNLTSLVLRNNNLVGAIPYQLSRLPKIATLDLGNNHLTNPDVTKLAFMSSLQLLYLGGNKLNGTFPPFILNHTFAMLKYLDLSGNAYSGSIPENLQAMLPNLETLDLSSNMFSGSMPRSFSRLVNLSGLNLGNNNFTGGIPKELGDPSNLMLMDLSRNIFTGSINEAFCQLGILRSLDLSNNRFSGVLPGCLWNLSLMYMDLSSNAFVGELPTLTNLSSALKSVHLAKNNFTGCFPFSLKTLRSLVSLDLGENKFSGIIPPWIGASFPLLRILRLRSNMFHGSIPWELSQLSHLQLLDLAENDLTGSTPVSLSNFTYIDMSKNFTYIDMIDQGYQLGDCTFICNGSHSLDDQMDIVWKGKDYTFKRSSMLMTGIDLSSNSLSGEIPAELLNLGAIRFLNLSRNNLSGAIPSNIGNLKDVESLDLSWNKLSGHIPSSISHLMFLNTVNLSSNLLSGEIPTGSQLQTLNDPSIYINNLGLCGPPLSIECTNNSSISTPVDGAKEHHQDMWLCYSVIAGVVFGFWYGLEHCLSARSGGTNTLTMVKYVKFNGSGANGTACNPFSCSILYAHYFIVAAYKHATHPSATFSEGAPFQNSLSVYYLLCAAMHGQFDQHFYNRSVKKSVANCKISREGEALLRWNDTLLNSISLSSWSRFKPTCYWDRVTCDEGARYVTHLDLSYSSLHGTLDAFSFSAFRHLAVLDLSSNNIFGAIPTNISLLLDLTILVLSYNNLVGAIPDQLSRLPKIATLELTNNHLTNPDVTKFSHLSRLQSLLLGGNKLNCTFPQFILNRSWVRLQLLDLSGNGFSGLIQRICFSVS